MKKGMSATVTDYPGGGVNTTYVLNTDPAQLLTADGNEDSIIDDENWRSYWDEQVTTVTSRDVVYQYTTNYLGGIPPFDAQIGGTKGYTSDDALRNEDQWVATLDKAKSHKWFRQRDSDDKSTYTDPDAGPDIVVYDNWSRPLPIGNQYETGDYINNQFKREFVDQTPITVNTGLVIDKFYSVTAGQVDATRTSDGALFPKAIGAKFQKTSGFTYAFAVGTSCVQVVDIPPRTLAGGQPNNNPTGWSDTIPTPIDPQNPIQLWKIFAHKTIYGNLKSEWNLEKINEQPELIRYSSKANPLPSILCKTTESVGDPYTGTYKAVEYSGFTIEQVLIAEGWKEGFEEGFTLFIAIRKDDGGSPPWTDWAVEKISDESGEFTDYVFKLFPINADYVGVAVDKPVESDPSSQGWQDAPIEETLTDINWVSKARKFLDGSLKSNWSDPVPYTGKDSFLDVIRLPDGNDFKYKIDPATGILGVVPVPAELRMQGQLVQGGSNMWQDPNVVMTFDWYKIFDNGVDIADILIDSENTGDDAYVKTTGNGAFTAEEITDGYRDGQILVVKAAYITGKAYFKLVQTLTTDEGDIVFTEIISVSDISDGQDRRALEASMDTKLTFYDPLLVPAVKFVPNNIQIVALYSNLPEVTDFTWWFNNGAGYTKITGAEPNYTVSGTKSSLLGILVDDGGANVLFAKDVLGESLQFAVSTHPSDPTLADGITHITDYITLSKSEGGAIGENAKTVILTNENYTVVLDSSTASPIVPFSGEVGTSGNAQSEIEVYNGDTRLSMTAGEFTAVLDPINLPNITADFTAVVEQSPTNVENARVYLNTWATNGARSCKVRVRITITSDSTEIRKEFTIGSTVDAPGALLLDLDSATGFAFDRPNGLGNKTIEAFVYNVVNQVQITEPPSNYYYEWSGAVTRAWTAGGAGGELSPTFNRSAIWASGAITCRISTTASAAGLLRESTVNITDITDAKTYRYYSPDVAQPTKPIDTITPESDPAGGVWFVSNANAIWASDGVEKNAGGVDPVYEFSEAYQITGEKGDAGNSGGFLWTVYQNVTIGSTPVIPTFDGATGSLGLWTAAPPVAEAGKYLWTTQRSWNAFQIDGTTPVAFVSGTPDTLAMGGSYWLPPSQVSGFDGINGDFVEFRYELNTSASVPPTIVTASSRNPTSDGLGGAWSVLYPVRASGQYVWETKAIIDGENVAALATNWETPTLKTGEVGQAGYTPVKGVDYDDGDSAYVYIGYATDASGNGFATTPSETRNYISVKDVTAPATNNSTLHIGNWAKYQGEDLVYSTPLLYTGIRNLPTYVNNIGRTRSYNYVWMGTHRSNSANDGWMQCVFQVSFNNGSTWSTLKTITSRATNNDVAIPITFVENGTVADGLQVRWQVLVTFSNCTIESESTQVIYI
jgi:hypothetical protein